METVQIDKTKLLEQYKTSDDSGRKLLTELYGASVFKGNIMDRVKGIRDACQELNRDYDVEFGAERTKYETEDETAYREMKVFFEALNEGWVPDYSNGSQNKYYAWVHWVSGRGLSLGVVGYVAAAAHVGPRLVLKNADLVRHSFECIYDTYKRFYNNKINK